MTSSFFVKIFLVAVLIFAVLPRAMAVEKPVIVAVIDGGVDGGHPELLGKVFGDIEHPQGSHGTKVAGIITGAAPEARIMSLSVCEIETCLVGAVSEAIRYAADNGAAIINISLVSKPSDGFTVEFDEAIKDAYERGVLVVAGAGNGDPATGEGIDLGLAPLSPVCNDNGEDMVLGVGSVDEYDVRSEWSNFGQCVDVYYPGENIPTIGLPQYDGSAELSVSGTSYAAAVVSGLAANISTAKPGISRSDLINEIKRRSPQVLGESTNAYLVFGEDDRTVYLVQNGLRRGFPTAEIFFSYGYKFSKVGHAAPGDLALPEGAVMR